MKLNHIELLVCPKTNRPLKIKGSPIVVSNLIKDGMLIEPISGNQYPIINFIPRFVPQDNYAKGFGFQWNIHNRTQHDKYSGLSASKDRFEKETKWGHNLKGEKILEVGCGAGRFTTHALDTGALVVSFDYSNAVEANYLSNGNHENLLLIQADVYEMPFPKNFFNKAFCFGVLQHTPDPKRAFMNIVSHLRPGGKIASDIYSKNIVRYYLHAKYWVRPFTKGSDPEKLYNAVKKYVNFMWPLTKALRRIPKVGNALVWRLLVADHSPDLPDADDSTLKEWAVLDTFDMLSPAYDKPQTMKTFKSWHLSAGLIDIDVRRGYNGYEGRGIKN